MAFTQFAAQKLVSGKTVPLILDMLVGRPTVHVEHMGDENVTWTNDRIARANSAAMASRSARAKVTKASIEADAKQVKEWVIKHVVRDLEARHSDGSVATKADIGDFIDSLPSDVVWTIFMFASNAENFREQPEPDVKELAGK